MFHGPSFVIAIIALSMGAWIITTWIRARHGYPVENEWGGQVTRDGEAKAVALIGSETEALKGKVLRLEERIAVLERIATDQPGALAAEIEALRVRPETQGEIAR